MEAFCKGQAENPPCKATPPHVQVPYLSWCSTRSNQTSATVVFCKLRASSLGVTMRKHHAQAMPWRCFASWARLFLGLPSCREREREFQGDAVEAFRKLGQTSEDVKFAETASLEVAKAAGLSEPGYVVIKNFKGGCPGWPYTVAPWLHDYWDSWHDKIVVHTLMIACGSYIDDIITTLVMHVTMVTSWFHATRLPEKLCPSGVKMLLGGRCPAAWVRWDHSATSKAAWHQWLLPGKVMKYHRALSYKAAWI
eukprot:1159286-Pelagomonas_calceolata.AAC.12